MRLKVFKRTGKFTMIPYEYISTTITVNEGDIIDLGKNIKGAYLEHDKKGYVFELMSGGQVGSSVKQVRNDIASCDDIEVMKNQIKNAVKYRDEAFELNEREFWKA